MFVACSRQENAAPEPLPRQAPLANAPSGPLVAFLGDSITAGYELRADQAFPALLRDQLAAQGTPIRISNAGVSGDTTAGGLRRVDWLLTQKPALVVIELGANDGLHGNPLTEIEQNLREIVRKVRAAGALPMLLGMRLPPSYGDPYASEFAALYERLGKELSVACVPFFMNGVAGVPELNLADGLHPTADGHQKLAATLLPPLAELLRTPR
jgi:acyl-CoA thioesterase I